MKVTEIKDSIVQRLDQLVENYDPSVPPLVMNSGVGRTEGVHLSSILHDLYNRLLAKKRGGQDNADCTRMSLGFCWERVLESVICDVFPNERLLLHPGEYMADGILMSPDAIDLMDFAVEEFKCTFQSATRTPEDSFDSWLWQLRSYCRAVETTEARLRVLFINGSYNKRLLGSERCAAGPCVRSWKLSFTRAELDSNWEMITNHARTMGLI